MATICLLFFFSGFSALVYELLWMRQLGLVFGNTVHAAATVVTAFMAGLAGGAYVLGRRVERARSPVRLFGYLELAIAALGVLMPALLGVLKIVYRLAYQHLSESLLFLTPLRFGLSMLLLTVPTFCMGGSLPVLVHGLVKPRDRFASRLGLLYGINTLGAAAGLLLSGFVLLPQLGLAGTGWIAVACNLAAGLGALAVARGAAPSAVASPAAPPAVPASSAGAHMALWAIGGSGFVALALEVVWFRALILVFGSTTYSFSAMLSVFLLGIAAGSLLLSRLLERARRPLFLLALSQAGIGLYTAGSLRWFNRMPGFLLNYLVDHSFTWAAMTQARFAITLVFLLVPTLLMGFAFTAASRVASEWAGRSARAVSDVYVFNTAGAVLGSSAAGFALLPLLGMERSLLLLAAVSLGIGVVVLGASRGNRRLDGTALVAVLAAGAWIFWTHPGWNRKLMAAGPYFTPWSFVQNGRVILRERLNSENLLFHHEGLVSSVSVSESDDQKLYFSSDGKVEADTSARSMMLQRLMGHLPMLFHPDPRRVLNIGLGAGVTLGAIGGYPVEHLEVVEIEPSVRGVAERFARWNHGIMARPGLRVTLGDGRNHLLCTARTYDVITSDPFEPVYAGANNLYTVEHFVQARDRLEEDGIMCQYLPLYELSPADFLTIVRSFVRVFPRSLMFFTGDDTLMLGFKGRCALDAKQLRQKYENPDVRASLGEIGLANPETILAMFVADLSAAPGLAGPGPLNTDGHPVIEFSAPKSALRYTPDANQQLLLEHFTALPISLAAGFSESELAAIRQQREALQTALRAGLLRTAGDGTGYFEMLSRAAGQAPGHPVIRDDLVRAIMASADSLREAGRLQEAAAQYTWALGVRENEFYALFYLVDLSMRTGRPDVAGETLDRALRFYPESALLLAFRGKYLAATRQDWAAAESWLKRAVDKAPWKAELWRDYASFAREAGNLAAAEQADREATRLESSGL